MNKPLLPPLFAAGLVFAIGSMRADPLDDLILSRKNGTSPAPTPAQIDEAFKVAQVAADQSYHNGLVDLYLSEIKLSLADPDRNGGWPYRSFLLDRFISEEDGAALRNNRTDALKERFAAKPDPIRAYVRGGPALFAGDEASLNQAQAYLKEHDPVLFKWEQDKEARWRSAIKATLAQDDRRRTAIRELWEPTLAELLIRFGHDTPLDTSATTALGLTKAGETLNVRQLTVDTTQPGHAYMRTGDGGFLLLTVSKVSARAFRANAKRELVSAVDKKANEAPVAIPVSDAKKELEAEFTYWISVADQY